MVTLSFNLTPGSAERVYNDTILVLGLAGIQWPVLAEELQCRAYRFLNMEF